MNNCQPVTNSTRLRKFWTYSICGDAPAICTTTCGKPGFTITTNGVLDTSNRAASMAMLILMTKAAQDSSLSCKRLPQTRSGYWADSFRKDNKTTGTQIYYIPVNATVAQTLAQLKAMAENDLQKMVALGEAESISVTPNYVGNGTVRLLVTIVIDGQNLDVPFAASGNGGAWTVGLMQ